MENVVGIKRLTWFKLSDYRIFYKAYLYSLIHNPQCFRKEFMVCILLIQEVGLPEYIFNKLMRFEAK